MSVIALLRQQLQDMHGILEGTLGDVNTEQLHWAPPGKANPLGATYAHLTLSEDMIINGMLKGAAPLVASSFAGKVGLSEPPPQGSEGTAPWDQWGRKVKIDLAALRQYAQAVYASTDAYLASLKDDDLNRPLDLSSWGMGQQTVGWLLNNAVVWHTAAHCGEVSCLKGLQGAQGYPF